MAPPLSDAVVVDVLRRLDRLTTPLVRRLARPPGLPTSQRDAWWGEQAAQVGAVASSLPRLAGRLADLLPLQNTVGTAVQSLVVLGVANEHGVTDPAERVSLLSEVLLDRYLPPGRVRPLLERVRGAYTETAIGAKEERAGLRGVVRTIWRASRLLGRIDEALDARPKGRIGARALSQLPVVGVLGGYAAEREALRQAARMTAELLEPGRRVSVQ
ncbi:hypothetical protein ACI798_04275 [Geodermatophilus sp. SYSU D01045]